MNLKARILTHVAAASVIAVAVPAAAQDTQSAVQNREEPTVGTDDGAIVVTALRREQALQDVPISISAVSAEALQSAGYRQTSDVLSAIPNVAFTEGRGLASGANIVIRGVGSAVDDVDQPVAVYIDDVFLAANGMFNANIVDLERVEVLRGPQGTLYGRNAMAGAVNFISVSPKDHFEGQMEASYGSYDYVQAKGMLNIPVTTGFALRANAAYSVRDGFVRRVGRSDRTNEIDNHGFRLQAKFDLAENFTATLSGDYSNDSIETTALAPLALAKRRLTDIPLPYVEDRDNYGGALRLTYNGDGFDVVSITAQRYLDDTYFGSDFLPALLGTQYSETDQRQFSQELRVVSTGGGALSWVAGLYYFKERKVIVNGYNALGMADIFGVPHFTEESRGKLPTRAIAAYANLSYVMDSGFEISVGARYGEERKTLDYLHTNTLGYQVFAYPQALHAKETFKKFLPRFNVSYNNDNGFLWYATVSQGSKSGGVNSAFLGQPIDENGDPIASPTNDEILANFGFKPESLWNYESGLKLDLGGIATLNGSVYYMDWKNQQIITFNGFVTKVGSAEKSRSYGLELELQARPAQDLELTAGIGLNDAKFSKGVANVPGFGDISLKGRRQPNNSSFTGSAAIQYKPEISSTLRMPIRVDVTYRSDQYFSITNDATLVSPINPTNVVDFGRLRQKGYALVNLRAGVEADNWAITLFAENVFNKKYIASGQPCNNCTTLNDYGVFVPPADDFSASIGEPRILGISGRFNF